MCMSFLAGRGGGGGCVVGGRRWDDKIIEILELNNVLSHHLALVVEIVGKYDDEGRSK